MSAGGDTTIAFVKREPGMGAEACRECEAP